MTRGHFLTAAQIDAAKTEKGGWTKAQLAEWGVPWPPPKGWREALITGSPIPAYSPETRHGAIAEMSMDELHALFRQVVLAVVNNGHADDLYTFPDVLAYFGACLPQSKIGPLFPNAGDGDAEVISDDGPVK